MAKYWHVHNGRFHYFLGEMTEEELRQRFNLRDINVADTTGLTEQPAESDEYTDAAPLVSPV